MNHIPRRSLTRDTKGATALEFAMVSLMLFAMLFGGIEVGMMLWTRGTLQSVAAQTARCVAIGSPLCNGTGTTCSGTTPAGYAVCQATIWLGGTALITASNVTIAPGTECGSTTGSLGSFEIVTITASPWIGSFVYPFNNHTETVTACFPI